MSYNSSERRYDIDWLRTLAFGVLILYHVGMYYVTDWGWHIKSAETSTALQDLMILTNPWRMSLLFFIAGIALALVQGKYSSWKLAGTRTTRLFIPLLFGMFVIVVPQVYYEALSQNLIQPGFISFWMEYINPNTELLRDHHSPIGLLTWNHLWFLPYLWLYSLIFIAIARPVNAIAKSNWLARVPLWVSYLAVVCALIAIWIILRTDYPPKNNLTSDWYNHGKYLLVFGFGYIFALQKNWWQRVIETRNYFLLFAVLGYITLVFDRHDGFDSLLPEGEFGLGLKVTIGFILSVNHWSWILAVVGFAGFWLNRPSKNLRYATNAILPWYMLHQTLIVVFAWWLKPLGINIGLEAPLLIGLTTAGCYLGYELIKRFALLRFLCGLRVGKAKPKAANNMLDLEQTSKGTG